MTAYYTSNSPDPLEWAIANKKAREALEKVGAIFDPRIVCGGVPHIRLVDFTVPHGSPLDPAPFHGRIRLHGAGPKLNSGPYGPFPIGPVRLTVVRWGEGADRIGEIEVGDGTELNGTAICSYRSVRIGKNVLVGADTIILDGDGHEPSRERAETGEGSAPIAIGDGAWIGVRSLILKGVTIGSGAIVGAGSIVTKSVPDGAAVAGNPARIIRRRA